MMPDAKWKRVRFSPTYRESVPEIPGVYAVCSEGIGQGHKLMRRLYNVLYVGRATASLRQRFLQHCKSPGPEIKRVKLCFGSTVDFWFTEVEPEKIPLAESRLIICLGPSANKISGAIEAKLGAPRPA